MADIRARIAALKAEKDAVILSHTYQPGEIQDIADFVGDSYGLSKKATELDARVIVFCGVRFMAETAAVLNPDRTVLLPDMDAGCPLADMIKVEELRQLKRQYPGAPVVCYVNSSAEVKAESTVCCTSSNAVCIVESLADAEEIIFVPDQYLGKFVERKTGRKLILWDGYCPTHAMLRAGTVRKMQELHPGAEVMVHPECPPQVQDEADHVLSTGQMCDLVKTTDCRQFLVGTEEGIIHTLKKEAPAI
ncbi:MAG: quinolinate synthase NadA, partial [Lentisphaeria bacterium]